VTTSIERLERWFADAVTAETDQPETTIDRVLTRGLRMTAAERLGVYRSGYRARLVECLADDYPAVKHLLGDDAFEALVLRYVDAHPSRSPSLNGFGRSMPAFARSSGIEGASFVSDLARLEWALVEAIHAAPAAAISPERLEAIAPEEWAGARLRAAPSVQLLRFDHAVDAYYQAFRDDRPAIVSAAPSATLVHRHGWVVWRRDLTPPMARLLDAILGGSPLGDALAIAASEGEGSAPADVTAWFKDWVAGGVFSDVHSSAERR
jgi:hypothetical protein